jgi:hypothetical protein
MASKYVFDQEVEDLAKTILEAESYNWPQLPNVKFLVLETENCDYLGKCSKVTGKWKYLTGYNYVIEVWRTFWDSADFETRKALLNHEILHIEPVYKRDESFDWGLKKHDVEEFYDIVVKYGCWNDSLKAMKEAINNKAKIVG